MRNRAGDTCWSRHVAATLALVAALEPGAHAACDFRPQDALLAFSAQARIARDSLFDDECDSEDTQLVSPKDARLAGRVLLPPGRQMPTQGPYPDAARVLGLEGNAVVAFIVETDGHVAHARVIQSSGHKLLDDAAREWAQAMRFSGPGTVDQKPVRELLIMPINFKLTGKVISLPSSFSDAVLTQLGLQAVNLINAPDIESVARILSQTGPRLATPQQLLERAQKAQKALGHVYSAQYTGVRSIEKSEGTPYYQLRYRLSYERSAAMKFLVISVIARDADAGLLDFTLRSSP